MFVADALAKCLMLLPGDITSEAHCKSIVDKTVAQYGKINILVNNAAFQVRFWRTAAPCFGSRNMRCSRGSSTLSACWRLCMSVAVSHTDQATLNANAACGA